MEKKIVNFVIIPLLAVTVIYQAWQIEKIKREVRKVQEIAVVLDIDKVLKEVTISLAKQNLKQEEIASQMKDVLMELERSVNAFKDRGVLILDKKCVVAGSIDITDDIREVLNKRDKQIINK